MLLPDFVVALCRLHPGTMQALASSAGLTKSNFASALALRRPFPKKCEMALFASLGLEPGGRLASDRLHRWRVRDVANLRTLLSHGLAPARLYPLALEGTPPPLRPLWLLVSRNREVYAVLDGYDGEKLAELAPECLPGNVSLAVSDWAAWESAALPVEAVKILLRNAMSEKGPEWNDVIRACEGRGIGPKEALALLSRRRVGK